MNLGESFAFSSITNERTELHDFLGPLQSSSALSITQFGLVGRFTRPGGNPSEQGAIAHGGHDHRWQPATPGHPQEAPAIVGPACSSRPPSIAPHLAAQPRTAGMDSHCVLVRYPGLNFLDFKDGFYFVLRSDYRCENAGLLSP